MGFYFLFQGIFPTQKLKLSCISCVGMWILYRCATWEAQEAQEGEGSSFFKNNFIYLFTCGCAGSLLLHWASLVAASRDYPSLQGPGFSPWSTGSGRVGFSCGRGLSSCGARAQVPHGMWDLPGPGTKPVSLMLEGRFLTTGPRGKPPDAPNLETPTLRQDRSPQPLRISCLIPSPHP